MERGCGHVEMGLRCSGQTEGEVGVSACERLCVWGVCSTCVHVNVCACGAHASVCVRSSCGRGRR